MKTKIALRIHVGTIAGACRGIPELIKHLQALEAGASFLLCLGPDHSGRALRTSFKTAAYCGWSSLFRGTLLPGSTIEKKALKELQEIEHAGFEAGLSAWNRVSWEKEISAADNAWIAENLDKGRQAFEKIYGHPPKVFGAPDWQGHRHHLRLLQRLGFTYASDSRGTQAFIPVFQGEPFLYPQIPTSLPTLEDLFRQKHSEEKALEILLRQTDGITSQQVFSLRAEFEGLGHMTSLLKLFDAWQHQGHQLVSLGDLASEINLKTLPYACIGEESSPFRTKPLLVQGEPHFQ